MEQFLPPPPQHDHASSPIEVQNLTVGYDGRLALEDISFTIEQAQRVAVVGPNGSGKTTLFKVLAGTLIPDVGTVQVYGHGPCGHVCIAYVPQRSQIDWNFPVSVSDVVMMSRARKIGFARWPKKSDWQVVHEALDRVDMADLSKRQIGELSGGQQQRVFLARALAQGAEVILLDEPLTGLDTPSQETMFRILDELHKENVTIMVATHDLSLAADRFDTVMLINRRLVALGPPDKVFTRNLLLQAYGSQMHVLPVDDESVAVLTDTCCEGDEEAP
jgi:manganese/iron transport system ATP-binding protein